MSGNRSRLKGYRAENKLVHMLQEAGLAAWRCPLSGGARGRNTPPNATSGFDIMIPLLGRDAKIEVKHHGNGFKRLYEWLAPVDLLMVRCDHAAPLVVMPFQTLIELIMVAEGKKSVSPISPDLFAAEVDTSAAEKQAKTPMPRQSFPARRERGAPRSTSQRVQSRRPRK